MKRLLVVGIVLLLIFTNPVLAQQDAAQSSPQPTVQQNQSLMTNADVIEMLHMGLSEGLVIDKISTATATSFDTNIAGLRELKGAGVPDAVIRAMITAKPSGRASNSAFPAPGDEPVLQSQQSPQQIFHSTDGKVRIFVTDNPIFEQIGIVRGGSHASGSAVISANGSGSASSQADSSIAGYSHTEAGDNPRTVEVQADMKQFCPSYVQVSNNPERADYLLIFRRQGGTRSGFFALGGLTGLAASAVIKVDGASLFQPNGDMIYSTRERTVEKTIRAICQHIPALTEELKK